MRIEIGSLKNNWTRNSYYNLDIFGFDTLEETFLLDKLNTYQNNKACFDIFSVLSDTKSCALTSFQTQTSIQCFGAFVHRKWNSRLKRNRCYYYLASTERYIEPSEEGRKDEKWERGKEQKDNSLSSTAKAFWTSMRIFGHLRLRRQENERPRTNSHVKRRSSDSVSCSSFFPDQCHERYMYLKGLRHSEDG